MINVYLDGRMGNQMFQYAFARWLQVTRNKNDVINLDFSAVNEHGKKDPSFRNYLGDFNCIGNIKCDAVPKYAIIQRFFLSLFYKGMKGKRLGFSRERVEYEKKWAGILSIFGIYIYTIGYYPYKISMFNKLWKNVYVSGYFESALFFDQIKDVIIKDFSPSKEVKHLCDGGICINVRCGDFLDSNDNLLVCDKEYYRKAVELINDRRGFRQKLYVFSDDIEWCRSHLGLNNEAIYIDNKVEGIKAEEQMMIMRNCRDYVISNSSYSWWAQYLSFSDDKIVVAPAIWRRKNSDLYNDIYENNWVCI